MKTKHYIIYLTLLFAFCVRTNGGNVITLSSASGAPEQEVTISVNVQNDDPISSLQLLIPIDDNISLIEESAILGSRCTNHSIGMGVKDDCISIFIYSLSMATFAENNGEVVSFRLKLGSQPQIMELEPSKVVALGSDGQELTYDVEAGEVKTACAKAVLSTLDIDYGRVPINDTYSRIIQVKNEGNEDLDITQLIFSNVNIFSTTSQFPMNIKPEETKNIEIQFSPIERVAISGYIKLISNSVSKLNTITLSAEPYAVNEIHFQPASGISDEIVPIVMEMNNMDHISGLQFEIEIPDELEYIDGSFTLSERKEDHTAIATIVGKKLILLSYSPTDKPFKGNDGEICSFNVKLKGNNNIWLKPCNVVLSATIENVVENVNSGYDCIMININSPKIYMSSSLDLGSVPITEVAKKELVIQNFGNAPLTINKFVSDNECLSVLEELPLVINSYQNKTVTVAYSSTEETSYSSVLSIYNNDPSNRVVNVVVSGNRFAPNYLDVNCPKLFTKDSLHIDISFNNYDVINGIQFDVEYPNELYETYENNYTLYENAKDMLVNSREIENGKLRYFCYFISGGGINPNAGKLLTIHMRPKVNTIPEGTYNINISNIIMGTDKLTNKYAGNDLSVPVVIMPPLGNVKAKSSEESMGSVSLSHSGEVELGTVIEVKATTTCDGYSFKNWTDANGNVVSTDNPFTFTLSSDIELTANFKANEYPVTFEDFYGSKTTTMMAYGSQIPKPDDPKITGYTFKKWLPNDFENGDVYVKIGGNEYKPYFEINQYTLTFDTDGGSAIGPITQDFGTEIKAPSDPTKTGYTFAGWDKDIPANMPAENITFKAKWNINQYNVKFIVNGDVISEETLEYGAEIITPEAPEIEGYTFTGWSPEVSATVPANDVSYEALYNVNTYRVTYYINDVVVKIDYVNYGDEIPVYEPTIEDNMKFDGWIENIPSVMPAKDIEIHGTTSIIDTSIDNIVANYGESFIIYDLSGKAIKRVINESDVFTIPSGLYIIKGVKVYIHKGIPNKK